MSLRAIFPAVLGALLATCGTPSAGNSPAALPTAQVVLPPTHSAIVRLATPNTRRSPTFTPAPPPTTTPAPTFTPTPPTLAPAPTTTPAPPNPGAPPGDPAEAEALLVVAMNRERAAHGLPSYQHSPELSATARAHSCDLAAHSLISHTSSDGRTLAQRLAGSDPPWEWPSESIAAGTDDPSTVVAWWMDEPPEGWHRRNILDLDQREVGVGYCYAAEDPTGNHHYWTADFSRRSSQ